MGEDARPAAAEGLRQTNGEMREQRRQETAGGTDGEKHDGGGGGGGGGREGKTTKTNTDIKSHRGGVSEPREAARAAEKTAAGVFVTALQGLRPPKYGEAREGDGRAWVTEGLLGG